MDLFSLNNKIAHSKINLIMINNVFDMECHICHGELSGIELWKRH